MRRCLALAIGAVVLACAPPADAAWSASGTGPAAARAVVMPAGSQPSASVSGSDVTLRWPAALLPGATPVAGYVVTRYGANGQAVTVLAGCAGTVATTTCTEHNVPAGSWTYTDTPVQGNWNGPASPMSAPVPVGS
jgi:hypothetical protein